MSNSDSSEADKSLGWDTEVIYSSGDLFFDAVDLKIKEAKNSIDVEMYIFAADTIGTKIFQALLDAAKRGVKVRIIVDGIGSSGWVSAFGEKSFQSGIKYKVYHPPSVFLLNKINRRTHRKLIIIDQEFAFVGSMNLTDPHSESVKGADAWRDTSICVSGSEVKFLENTFKQIWLSLKDAYISRVLEFNREFPSFVRLNATWRERRRSYTDLKNRIKSAKRRIWIATGYFVPTRSITRLLGRAAKRGVDVRILISSQSDIFFIPWVTDIFSLYLLNRGVKIFDYQPSVQHAKVMIIDDWNVIGTSNFNHRSIFHDLEIDIVLTKEESKQLLEDDFNSDILKSKEISIKDVQSRSFFAAIAGRIIMAFKAFL